MKTIKLFFLMLLYKLSLDIGFWKILVLKSNYFSLDFSIYKYILGFVWCIILFFAIDHLSRSASAFLLYLILLLQIVPITTVFSLKNENSLYYHMLCTCFLITELAVRYIKMNCRLQANERIPRVMILLMGVLTILLMISIYKANGFPTLIALNIFDVYKLRGSSEAIHIGKYSGYILTWITMFLIPFLLVKSIYEKKFIITIVTSIFQFIIYLYTGHKTYLFEIFVCIFFSFLTKKSDFYYFFYQLYSMGVVLLTFLAILCPVFNNFWIEAYSLLIRRILIVPANLKFVHFDYFSSHPKMGLYGAVPQKLLFNVPEYYKNISFPFEIGRIYFDAPNMSADTGAFAEGYMRLGYIGIVLIFLICIFILKQVDILQKRTSFSLATSFFIFPIYSLIENQLIKNVFFGYWLFWIIILLFFKKKIS